jgi:dsDNA-specific endonuclease/ATPase MutS2
MILALQPCTYYEQVKSELALCKEARYMLDTDPAFNMDSLKDISDLSRQASRGKIFEPAQLLEVSNSIRIVQQVIDRISCRGKEIPLLQSLASRLMQPGDLEIEITKTISQGGEIYSSSSARLAQIRNQLKTLREQILRTCIRS